MVGVEISDQFKKSVVIGRVRGRRILNDLEREKLKRIDISKEGTPPLSASSEERSPSPSSSDEITSDSSIYKHSDFDINDTSSLENTSSLSDDNSYQTLNVLEAFTKTRPQECTSKCGQSGTRIMVQTNYFKVIKKPTWRIHQYRIDFIPDVESIQVKSMLIAKHKDIFGGYIFDGTVLFTHVFLSNCRKEPLELKCKLPNGSMVLVKVKFCGAVSNFDIQQLHVLNLVMRRSMTGLNLQRVKRNLFDPAAKILLEDFRLEIWPGYVTSIRQHESDILVCTEIAHKVMRTDSVYSIFQQCIKNGKDYKENFKAQVIGTIVLTDYNNKTYRIDNVDFTKTPMFTFDNKGVMISLKDYYLTRYNLSINDWKQPLLVSSCTERDKRGGRTEPVLLIPEITRATGITDEMRNNFRLMKAMSDHTRLTPSQRLDRLKTFNKRLQSSPDSMSVLKTWNLGFDTSPLEIPARILPFENILFGNNVRIRTDDRADWTNGFRSNSMFRQTNIKNWVIITPNRISRDVQNFVDHMKYAAKSMSYGLQNPIYERIGDDRHYSYIQAIDAAATQDPQIMMVVLMTNNAEKYSAIKKRLCVDHPIPSQVVTMKTVAPRNKGNVMSMATKVVIQMNAKLMGVPWMLHIPIGGTMIVGFDVCHSMKLNTNSYGAMVATMDMQKSSRYFSAVMEHAKGQELSNDIAINMTFAIRTYKEEHGRLPERILFYRDGVGDGQIDHVFKTEVVHIRKTLGKIYQDAGIEQGCRMAFILVSKTINSRYFLNNRNPSPGTVVDSVITLPERYDFFLVSQSVHQGTVTPTSYNIIFDTMGLNADKLQILTYKLSHLYYNWSGTCRVPSVCQYAHKLANLVVEHIKRPPSSKLQNQLYFL